MREFIEAIVSDCRKLPKRECDFRLAILGVFLKLLARRKQRGQALNNNALMSAFERIPASEN